VEQAHGGRGASIINVGSESGLRPLSRVFTYSMTKAAVHNLTKSLAREWGPLGIRCNVLVPGFFPAEQNRAVLTPDRIEAILGHTPLGRFGDPDDLNGAMLLLASDAGRFINGAELVVDGGFEAVSI
ncbi:MAG TPA: SDR family oxidoreductase, partial [Ilumatobacteraceae bacterium]